MENTAPVLAKVSVDRTLHYRPQLRWTGYALVAGGVALACAMFLGLSHPLGLVLAAFCILAAWSLNWFIIRALASVKIRITNEGLTVERRGHTTEISFVEVKQARFHMVPYLGGWFTLRTADGKTIRISALLERSEYILDALFASNPVLIGRANFEKYYSTTIVLDHHFARNQDAWREWYQILLFTFLPPAVWAGVSLLHSSHEGYGFGPAFILFSAASAFFGLALYLAYDFWIMHKKYQDLSENLISPMRDLKAEKAIRQRARFFQAALVSILALAFIFI